MCPHGEDWMNGTATTLFERDSPCFTTKLIHCGKDSPFRPSYANTMQSGLLRFTFSAANIFQYAPWSESISPFTWVGYGHQLGIVNKHRGHTPWCTETCRVFLLSKRGGVRASHVETRPEAFRELWPEQCFCDQVRRQVWLLEALGNI